jgi:hypothetical protein
VAAAHVSRSDQVLASPADSADRIHGDNVIEHFSLNTARVVLRRCWKPLGVGGRLGLATPGMERMARAYLDDPQLTAAHLDRHQRHGFPAEHPVDMLGVTYAYHGHHLGCCFGWAALSAELATADSSRSADTGPGRAMTPRSAAWNSVLSPRKGHGADRRGPTISILRTYSKHATHYADPARKTGCGCNLLTSRPRLLFGPHRYTGCTRASRVTVIDIYLSWSAG